MLEPPWRHNIRNLSCIPSGTYQVHHLPKSASGRYKDVYHLQDVTGRSGILIHAGNVADHTKGCLIIGKRKGRLAGKRAVLNSRTALTELHGITERKSFKLHILGNQHA